jgi:D-ribose pyranase
MLKSGILNPYVNSLLSRVRHTNTLVLADRGFPFWPQIETIDLTVVDNLPRVLDVLQALLPTFNVGRVYLASEFFENNGQEAVEALQNMLCGVELVKEPHLALKQRVPFATGLIRTADTNPYSNLILESA